MNRRKFLSRTGFGVISTAAAAQAVAQTPALPEVRWRCASSFPKSLDTIYGGGETIAKRVTAITGGKFQIRVFGAGEIVPAFGTVDAVQQGTVECTHTASYYFVGKNKTFAFDTTLPFGMNQRQQNAWIYYGGGLELVHAEGQGCVEGEGFVLADEVIARRVGAFHGSLLHGVDRAEGRHDLARAEHADLELAAGDRGDALGNGFAASVDGIQALRPARCTAPAHLGQRRRLRHGLRGCR